MAIHRTYTQSELEKRLQVIRKQVYGKKSVSGISPMTIDLQYNSDIKYLHHDLLKIAILSSFALSIQIALFYLLKNNILKLNLF